MKKINLKTKENELPLKRNGHASFVYKGCIYIFGGQSDVVFSDFLKISLETFEIEKVEYSKPELKRDGHCFFEYKDEFYLYGGFDGKSEYPFVYKNFEKLNLENEPTARCYFSSVVHQDSLYIYGGESPRGCLRDLHKLDLKERKWTNLGDYKFRACHSACVVNNKMYVYGGYYHGNWLHTIEEFDFHSKKWSTIDIKETPRLGGYSMVSYNNKVYIYGGYNGDKLQNSLYSFDPFINQFTKVKFEHNSEYPGRCDQTMVEYRNKFYILGGDNSKYLELLELDLKINNPFPISPFLTDCIIFTKSNKRKRGEKDE